MTFFICHVTSRGRVIEETCDFVVSGSSSQATILSSLGVTGLVKVEDIIFFICYVISSGHVL